MSKKNLTLAERHALKRLDKVEQNQQKAYEKKPEPFPWKTLIMGACFVIILILFLIQIFIK
ncbi:hypothetical protein [uncultured Lactobacillus sp.]|uniref:hypothetical protein n=1 Tax=uncultured Lactobacillus sp. TaxID=153152 RepID=UPI0026106199|nr:hypothetical protein [uncultured Lactobacillus sp.]